MDKKLIDKSNKLQILRRWTKATAIGWFLGIIAMGLISDFSSTVPKSILKIDIPIIPEAIVGAIGGIILGFNQSSVLKRIFEEFDHLKYSILTAIAVSLLFVTMSSGLLKIDTESSPIQHLFVISVFLFSIGIAQFMVLKRFVKKAGLWIFANAIAWPVGLAVAVTASLLLEARPLVNYFFMIASVPLMGIVAGLITGIALIRLIDKNET